MGDNNTIKWSSELKPEDLLGIAKIVNGKRRLRLIGLEEATILLNLINENPDARNIRVYSSDGFVAKAYGPTSTISCFEMYKETIDGVESTMIHAITRSASEGRSKSRTTMNGRAI